MRPTLTLKTLELANGRVQVSDGQGTAGTYDTPLFLSLPARHGAAVRRYLSELKGWPDADLFSAEQRTDGVGYRISAAWKEA